MKNIITSICLLTAFFASAKDMTIVPQFNVGDTLRYRTTAQVIMYHGKDSLFSVTELLPQVVVEERNDTGFVLRTTNRLESFRIVCSDPTSEGMLPDKTDELNNFVASRILKIQLDSLGRPDSILNMAEVKTATVKAFLDMFVGPVDNVSIMWSREEMENNPMLVASVSDICAPAHLIDEQFGNLPYFRFTGIPLKSGKIPIEKVMTEEMLEMNSYFNSLKELKFDIRQTTGKDISERDGYYTIKLHGKKGQSEIEGLFLYAGGIMCHGLLSITHENSKEKLTTNYLLEPLE